jgi:hypothetical protein
LSDNEKKPEENSAAGNSTAQSSTAPLPGIGTKPATGGLPGLGGGLPGIGAKPAAGGGLPGIGGGGLPGIGAKPVAGGGLPGIGGGAAPVPPFLQQEQKPAGPSPEQLARDPFGADNLPAQRPSFAPDAGLISAADDGSPIPGADSVQSKKPLMIGVAIVAILFLGIGFMSGNAISGRVSLNIAIRDARIVQYEMQKLKELLDEVQGMVNTATSDAMQKKFNKQLVPFLSKKITGNPFKVRIFTDRNYKTFDPMAVQMMLNLYLKWGEFAKLFDEHRLKTNNDIKSLTAAGAEFAKLLQTQYGVVFKRNKKAGGRLEANLVVLGGTSQKGGDTIVQVQTEPGSFGDDRVLYNPQGEDSKLSEHPDNYVIPVGEHSKATLLKNVTQSQFDQYAKRLKAMSDLLKTMREDQENMFSQLDKICSQEPVSFLGGINVEEDVEEYIAKDKTGGGESAQ